MLHPSGVGAWVGISNSYCLNPGGVRPLRVVGGSIDHESALIDAMTESERVG
ncbi:MAG: hypothetical protein JWQ10_610 [Herbaspirillum sp.]|nr:hypothetical protein [Herbaspirillum sp.]